MSVSLFDEINKTNCPFFLVMDRQTLSHRLLALSREHMMNLARRHLVSATEAQRAAFVDGLRERLQSRANNSLTSKS